MFRETVLAAGLTQQEVATILDVNRVTINKYMTGKSKPHKLHSARVEHFLVCIKRLVELKHLPFSEDLTSEERKPRVAQLKDAIKKKLAG